MDAHHRNVVGHIDPHPLKLEQNTKGQDVRNAQQGVEIVCVLHCVDCSRAPALGRQFGWQKSDIRIKVFDTKQALPRSVIVVIGAMYNRDAAMTKVSRT